MSKINVLMLPGVACDSAFPESEFTLTYSRANEKVQHYDLLCLSGGGDVNPSLYGEEKLLITQTPNQYRDRYEHEKVQEALVHGVPIVGICRGIQFLTVEFGGKLVQHIEHHAGTNHAVKVSSPIQGYDKGYMFRTNSCHHQLCLPTGGVTLATAAPSLSGTYQTGSGFIQVEEEVEAYYWPQHKSGGVQWHPEWMAPTSDGARFFVNLVKTLVS